MLLLHYNIILKIIDWLYQWTSKIFKKIYLAL